MKLHDNSRFGGRVVISGSPSNFLKTKAFIKQNSGGIGFPHLQEYSSAEARDKPKHQRPTCPLASKSGRDRQVQNLAFVAGYGPPNHKPGNLFAAYRDEQVVVQVQGGIPMGGFRSCELDSGNRGEIGRLAASDYRIRHRWQLRLLPHGFPAHNTLMPLMLLRSLIPLLFMAGGPFWETHPPERWTDAEIVSLRQASPWAQFIEPAPDVLVWLATAAPILDAEAEARLRGKTTEPEPDPDYAAYLADHTGEVLVLAIQYPTLNGLGDAAEDRRMEQECLMKVGKKSYAMLGHFPPVPADPVLRLVFPREVKAADKQLHFQLYLPGIPFPEREVDFPVKDLMYHGKLAM